MARLITCGYETQRLSDIANYDGESHLGNPGITRTGSGAVITTSTVRSGAAAVTASLDSQGESWTFTQVLGRAYFQRTYMRFADASPGTAGTVIVFEANSIQVLRVQLNTDGTLTLHDANGTQVGSASAALANDTWYRVETKLIIPSSGNGTVELYLDGTLVASSSSANVNNSVTSSRLLITCPTDGIATFWDDVALNDDQGSAQNSYPGDGKIVLLRATGDNARGVGWVQPQTSGDDTTDIYDAVDNLPPVGVTHSDVDANNLKYVFNDDNLAAAANYDANCQTYTAAGIAASDTVTLTQALVRLSTASSFGTNNMNIRCVSNPADAADTTCNAELSAVAGTDPTGWKSYRTPVIYNPSVTKDTAPVVRVTKTLTGSTRAHMVDLMGVIVEYQPPAGQTLTPAAEADAAQALAFVKPIRKTLGEAAETDAAQAASFVKPIKVTAVQAAEADAATVLAAAKLASVTAAAESDTAQPLRVPRIAAATEADAAVAVTAARAVTIVAAAEADLAAAVDVDKRASLAAAAETATAVAFTAAKAYPVTLVAETDAAQPLRVPRITTAAETDTAAALTAAKAVTLAAGLEADLAELLRVPRLAPALEIDLATDLSVVSGGYALTPAQEADQAAGLTVIKHVVIVQAAEADAAVQLAAAKALTIVVAAETDAALALAAVKALMVGVAGDVGLAIPLVAVKRVTIVQAGETDAAQAAGIAKLLSIIPPAETDTAAVLAAAKLATVAPAGDVSLAFPLAAAKMVTLAAAGDGAAALPLSPAKLVTLTAAGETDLALTFSTGGGIQVFIVPAVETDIVVAVTAAKLASLFPAAEIDTAVQLAYMLVVIGRARLAARLAHSAALLASEETATLDAMPSGRVTLELRP